MKKLSECKESECWFVCDDDTVSLQFILKQIYNGEKLPEICLMANDEQFNSALSDVLHQMCVDYRHGVDKDRYEIKDVDTEEVEIDITKDDIKKIDEFNYELKSY